MARDDIVFEGYFDLAAAVVARAAKSCLVHCEGGFRAQKNPHGAPEGKERSVDAWAWLTGRGDAARIEARFIYECCDIDAPRVLSQLWQQMVTIDRERAFQLEEQQTEAPKYGFDRYARAPKHGRLPQATGNQPEPAGGVCEVATAVSADVRHTQHPDIIESGAGLLA